MDVYSFQMIILILCLHGITIVAGVSCIWTSWTSCSQSCGGGTRTRVYRCCDAWLFTTIPCYGGRDDETQIENCGTDACPSDGNWGTWIPWSPCSVTCGQGTRRRTRACNDPAPSGGGSNCIGSSTITADCLVQPVDGGWGSWGSWSSCSVTCGYGEKIRHRSCNRPAPRCGGAFCADRSWSSKQCFIQPVHGGWGQWGAFGPCSATCAGGVQARTRRCDNPTPAKCGNQCFGASAYNRQCNNQECPVDGVWNQWESWSICSVSCGEGERTRYRKCSEPQYGGRDCLGNSTDSIQCIIETVDGSWSEWNEYSECSATCDGGIKTRHRSCSNPTPAFCGAACSGNGTDHTDCNNAECQQKQHEDEQGLIDSEGHDTTQSSDSFVVNSNKSIVANDTTIGQNKHDLSKEHYVIIGACVIVLAIIAVIAIIVFSVRARRNKMKHKDEIQSRSEATTYETPEFNTEVTRTESAYASLHKDVNDKVH